MAAAVNRPGASFEVRSVKPLFETRRSAIGCTTYWPTASAFLIVSAADDESAAGITVTVNGSAAPQVGRAFTPRQVA